MMMMMIPRDMIRDLVNKNQFISRTVFLQPLWKINQNCYDCPPEVKFTSRKPLITYVKLDWCSIGYMCIFTVLSTPKPGKDFRVAYECHSVFCKRLLLLLLILFASSSVGVTSFNPFPPFRSILAQPSHLSQCPAMFLSYPLNPIFPRNPWSPSTISSFLSHFITCFAFLSSPILLT